VLIPLITQLLKPEVYQSDPLGMSETRVRAATLLSKVFLHYLVLLDGLSGEENEDGEKSLSFEELWITIVGLMDRLGNSGQGDMEEAVAENLKNMLLVLSNGGYLAPPDENPKREELWHETWKRINRFQPNLFAELFPEEAGKPARPRPSKDERAAKSEPVIDGREMDVAERKKGGSSSGETADGSDEADEEKVADKEG
jgi:brefeldin A-resistance guanine nucleotide exchange factor 1